MNAHCLLIFSLCLGAALPPATVGDDWPQWRGPHRDNRSAETGLLDRWPAGGPPLRWRATSLGAGYSSVSVAGDRIYTMGDLATSSFVIALNLAGKKLWIGKVGRTGGGGGYPGPRCTPAVHAGAVYALGQYGDLVCFSAADGAERWRKNLKSEFGGNMMSGWGYAESPLVDGDRLVCTPGGAKGTMLALNRDNGALIWRTRDWTDDAAYSSIVPIELGGNRQYVQLTDAHVAGVAAEDGRVLWRAPRQGRTAVVPTPVWRDRQIYVTSGYGAGCNLFQVDIRDGKFAVESVYANKVLVNHHGGVVLVGNHIYGYSDGKGWVCQDLESGNAVWEERRRLPKGSLTYADGHLYLRGESGRGTIALIEASPAGYAEKGRFDPPDRSEQNSWAHPVVAGGRLYLRDQDVLLCYDLAKK